MTFNTGITDVSTGSALGGSLSTAFTLTTGRTSSMHIILLNNPVATPQLVDGSYSFTLRADSAEQATLVSYFGAKAGWTTDMINQINAEINGSKPFFYLNASGGVYSLVDNFKQTLASELSLSPPYTVSINDDYPIGTYVYNGLLQGSNGATLPVSIVLVIS
jgi:hypothetical protein